jgi:transcriptional regulator with XRE-family HTH domain
MTKKNVPRVHADLVRLRKEAGHYLRRLREKADLTQHQLAHAVGIEYYTMISQIERGLARVPPDRLHVWAIAVGVEPREFAKRLLRYYEPYSWQIIFGSHAPTEDA